MEENLRKSILQTLAFFDIFEHPLTKEELFKYLYCADGQRPADYTNFIIQLEHQASLPGAAKQSQGFYFLPGREEIVATRQRRVKIVEEKMRIAAHGIKKLRWAPFVRAVFVCNTVAMTSADEAGDIDVFIIVKKGRIWLARLSATLILSLFRLRRTKKKIKNRICLSFYVTDDNLNLEKIAIEQPDIYLIYWIASLIPVYAPENFFEKIQQANKWVEKYLPNGLQEYVGANCCSPTQGAYDNTPVQLIKKMLEKIWEGRYGNMIEAQARGIQQAKMKMNFQSRQNQPGTSVIISDSMLKFHETDRREEYRDNWLEKLKIFNI